MSSFGHFLRRATVAGAAFAAASTPSIAGASTAGPVTAPLSSTASAAGIFPLSGTIGPVTYLIYNLAGGEFSAGDLSCRYLLVDTYLLPPFVACEGYGHGFVVYAPSGDLPVAYFH